MIKVADLGGRESDDDDPVNAGTDVSKGSLDASLQRRQVYPPPS